MHAATPRQNIFPYTTLFRSYLQMMIQHHAGALRMVDDLFNTSLAGQEVDVNVFANDVVTARSEEHTSELQSRVDLVCGRLLEKKYERPGTCTKCAACFATEG